MIVAVQSLDLYKFLVSVITSNSFDLVNFLQDLGILQKSKLFFTKLILSDVQKYEIFNRVNKFWDKILVAFINTPVSMTG